MMCAACAVRWLSCSARCPLCAGPCAMRPVQCALCQRDSAGGDVLPSRNYARRATCFGQCANGDIRFRLAKPRRNRPLVHAPDPGRVAARQENRFGTRETAFTWARAVCQVQGFFEAPPSRRRFSAIAAIACRFQRGRILAGRCREYILGKWNLVRRKDCRIW